MPYNDLTFDRWMRAVDMFVQDVVGLSIYDLEDQPFRDWYEDEYTPADAGREALEYAGF